jgi:hypothetical protein
MNKLIPEQWIFGTSLLLCISLAAVMVLTNHTDAAWCFGVGASWSYYELT